MMSYRERVVSVMVKELSSISLKDSLSIFYFESNYNDLDDVDKKYIDLIVDEDFGGVLDEKNNAIRMRYIP